MKTIIITLALASLVACSDSSDAEQPGTGLQDASGANDGSTSDSAADAGDPSRNADPADLDSVNGDPALDIAGSAIYFDDGKPWVKVDFHAAWPAPATIYFWSCSVLLGSANAPLVTYSVQSLSGTQSDSVDGLDKAKVTFATEANGFRVLYADASLVFDRYGLECSAKKTKTSTLAQDTSGSFPVIDKISRPFGP